MTYAFSVKLEGGFLNNDKHSYTVAAPNAAEALRKGLRQARRDSGYKRWAVVALERGGWIVS